MLMIARADVRVHIMSSYVNSLVTARNMHLQYHDTSLYLVE